MTLLRKTNPNMSSAVPPGGQTQEHIYTNTCMSLLIITLKPTQREAGYSPTMDKTINKEI